VTYYGKLAHRNSPAKGKEKRSGSFSCNDGKRGTFGGGNKKDEMAFRKRALSKWDGSTVPPKK